MFLTVYAPQDAARRAEFRAITASAAIDSLYFHGDVPRSLALAESLLVDTNDAEIAWRAARSAIAAGTLAEHATERRLLYDRALMHARAAVSAQPRDPRSRYWLVAAAGRRAHRDDPVLSARLAVEVFDVASGLLAEDSTNASAHHALGMLHAEVARVPTMARFIASRVLRVDLASRASVREAERHLRRATCLDPRSVQYMADLAAFLVRARRWTEADRVIDQLRTLPALHPTDFVAQSTVIALRRESGHVASTRRSPSVLAAEARQ
jgi:hypothetical protein